MADAKGGGWKPFYDEHHKVIGRGAFGHGGRSGTFWRTIVLIVLAIAFGFWLNTHAGTKWRADSWKWLSTAGIESSTPTRR